MILSSLPQSGQSRYFQVTRRAHEYNDFLLKNGTTTGLPSSGKTRRSTLPRARRRDPRYVIALIDPVAYDRQTVLAETAGAVVGVANVNGIPQSALPRHTGLSPARALSDMHWFLDCENAQP